MNLLRFIHILVPINAYIRKLRGDSNLLPFLPQRSLLTLEPDEALYIDPEDMLGCFNLFKMPDPWAGFFAFEKLVRIQRNVQCSGKMQIKYPMFICELCPWAGWELSM